MATGIQSFSNPGDIGPLYPFAGTEVPLAIIGIVLWIAWHVLQNREESREWREAAEAFDEALLLPGAGEPARPVVAAPPPPPVTSGPAGPAV